MAAANAGRHVRTLMEFARRDGRLPGWRGDLGGVGRAWQREEDLRVVTVGDEVSFWLTFDEAERGAAPAEGIQVIQGLPGC